MATWWVNPWPWTTSNPFVTTATTTGTTGTVYWISGSGGAGSGVVVDSFRPLPRPAIIRPRLSDEERTAAAARAREVLFAELDHAQRQQLLSDGFFIVVGRRSRYRVRRAIAANIDVLDRSGRIDHRLCVHPIDHQVPPEDVMLAQLLHLRDDEKGLLRIANKHPAPGVDADADRRLAWAEERLAA